MASSEQIPNGLIDFRELLEMIETEYEVMGPGLTDALTEDEDFDHDKLHDIGDTLLVFIGREVRDMLGQDEPGHHLITINYIDDAIAAMEKAKNDLDDVIVALYKARGIAEETPSARELLRKQQERAEAAKRRAQEQHNSGA